MPGLNANENYLQVHVILCHLYYLLFFFSFFFSLPIHPGVNPERDTGNYDSWPSFRGRHQSAGSLSCKGQSWGSNPKLLLLHHSVFWVGEDSELWMFPLHLE
jgi:hypothetical protein